MKGLSFVRRLGFAWRGLVVTFQGEASFRTQVSAALLAVIAMLLIHPPLIWVALLSIMIGLVFALELFNTALEHALDGLHPEEAQFVRLSKDCAAAAVLVMSICAVIVFVLMLVEVYMR